MWHFCKRSNGEVRGAAPGILPREEAPLGMGHECQVAPVWRSQRCNAVRRAVGIERVGLRGRPRCITVPVFKIGLVSQKLSSNVAQHCQDIGPPKMHSGSIPCCRQVLESEQPAFATIDRHRGLTRQITCPKAAKCPQKPLSDKPLTHEPAYCVSQQRPSTAMQVLLCCIDGMAVSQHPKGGNVT